MSKAKAILQRIVDGDNRGDFFISNALLKEIEAALSEPEQEPVAWIIETEIYGKLSEWVCTDKKRYMEAHDGTKDPIPLYLAPPKREPLINIYVLNAFKADDEATHPYSYWAGVEFAEKHHGIVDEI